MRKLLALAVFIAVIAGTAAIIGAAQTAVDRHYDYLEAEQDNTRLERRLSALRADAPETGGTALPALVGAIAVLLAAGALVGQGGLVALLANTNRVIRSLRRPRSRARSRVAQLPPTPQPVPDRYIVRRPVAQLPPALPDGGAGADAEEEPLHWT